MKLNDIEISKAFLMSGENLVLSDGLEVIHPSVKAILQLGNGFGCDKVYWSYVFTMLCDPYDNMVWLDDIGIDYESVTPFDVFTMKWEKCIDEYNSASEKYDQLGIRPLDGISDALKFFLGNHTFAIGVYPDKSKGLYYVDNKDIVIDSNVFNYITSFIQLINGITHSGRINPANINAKKVLIEDKRDEQKRLQHKRDSSDNDDYFGDMIAAVVNGGNGGITPFNFKRLKMYQLYSAMSVEQKKSHFNHVMSGVYQGTVIYDKINKQELNWMN